MNARKTGLCLILLMIVLALGLWAMGEEAADITNECTITASNGGAKKLSDGRVDDYWQAKKTESTITIDLPAGKSAGGLLIEWFAKFDAFELTEYDEAGALIETQHSADFFRGHVSWLDLHENARRLKLRVFQGGRICSIKVYSGGEYPASVQRWQNPADKIDLMLIVAHQDDEELWFGGLLPYYSAVRGKNVQVVYMTSCGRARIGEALNGLWVMGVKTVPEVIGFKNSYSSVKESTRLWGGKQNIERALVRVIREYRPDVIVTHDMKGEYGHPQHKLTAMRMMDAIRAAADPNKYPDSAKQYGTWRVKKLYLHLSDTRTIYMDWDTPCEELDGRTPLEMAELGYLEHHSQQSRYNMDMGREYDYTKFGLVYSTVGDDVEKDDFLENTVDP